MGRQILVYPPVMVVWSQLFALIQEVLDAKSKNVIRQFSNLEFPEEVESSGGLHLLSVKEERHGEENERYHRHVA